MQKKYIKVTEEGCNPVVVMAGNEAYYKARGAKIESPTQEEIEAYFPEERNMVHGLRDMGTETKNQKKDKTV
jgi:predicted N-acetyltransferase YhbS